MTNAEATRTTESAAVAEQGAQVAPEKATSKKAASHKKGAPKASKGAKKSRENLVTKAMVAAKPVGTQAAEKAKPISKKASKPAAEAAVPREFSKKAVILDLLRRPKGATMAEIAKATDWQNHSIQGFISGNVTKKMGLTVKSTKNESGERNYKITM